MKQLIPPPSTEAIGTLLEVLAPGSTVNAICPLMGSFSNSTYLVEVDSATGTRTRIVVRRYAEFGEYDRTEKARREYKTLELLQAHRIPAPKPLYLDENGAHLGAPGIVTSFVTGQQVVAPSDPISWARALATMLARIHSIPCNAEDRDFLLDANSEAVWFLRSGIVPDCMQAHRDGADVWNAVRDLLPDIRNVQPTLVHIDYYSGNILWDQGQITAVLDWEEAAFGDPGIDVAYLRMELYTWGMEKIADVFLGAYVAEMGHPVENLGFWELAAAARNMPDPAQFLPESQSLGNTECTASSLRQNFAQFIASARMRAGL